MTRSLSRLQQISSNCILLFGLIRRRRISLMKMEDLITEWPPADSSLEPLRPLTPDVFDQDDIADLGISVGRKLSRSEIAGKLLDQLEVLNSEEPEPFDWFATEKTIDLPFFDNLPSPQYYNYRFQSNVQKFHNYATSSIKEEPRIPQDLNQYDGIPTNLGTPLTISTASSPHSYIMHSSPMSDIVPGQQSPTVPMPSPVSPMPNNVTDWSKADSPKDEEILKLLQEIETNEVEQMAMAHKILQEIESNELDQLVMTKVDDITPPLSEKSYSMDEFSDSGGAASPFVGSDSGLDDPEWSPPRRMKSVSGYSSAASCSTIDSGITPRRRSKPYSRPAPEERKQRKKEQNKNAATRYRMKKKAEVEEVRNEEKQLEIKNKELKDKFDDINREVKYLKSLMRDVYRKKGLIK